ncbi:MAG: hypothetical protein QOF94_2843 [Acidobacteriaceae bacterium]|jgi:hypothetical protein
MADFLGQIRKIWSPGGLRGGGIRAETNDALGSFPAYRGENRECPFFPEAVVQHGMPQWPGIANSVL